MAWPPPGSRAVVVGAFLPPSASDALVLSFSTALHVDVMVALLSSGSDRVGADVRRRWIARCAPLARVETVRIDAGDAESPEGPLRAALHDATLLVGADLRNLPLARRLGLQYVPVGVPWPTPDHVEASEAPPARWPAVPPIVQPASVRRVVVMGPESTGKTTLARDLARHFGTVWLPEYLRIWLDAKGAACEPADLPAVVAGHRASEEALARFASRVLFCDTDPLMTLVYSRFYYGVVPAWLETAATARRADAYLLLDEDVPWVPDAQRDMPLRRGEIRDLCRAELERRGLPWTLVRGAWPERFAMARGVVEGLLTPA